MDTDALPGATEAELSPLETPVEDPDELDSELAESPEEPESSESSDEEAFAEPRLSPSQQRIQREIEKRRQLEWDLAQARQSEARLQAQLSNRATFIDPQERQRRLEAMEPDERYQFLLNERDQATRGELNQLRYQMLSSNDSHQFQNYLARHPEFRKYEQEVEGYFQQAVSNGQPQSRNALLSWLIGERVRSRADGAVSRAKRQGSENLKKVATRPAAARSNVSGSERSSQMTAEQRLFMNLERGAYKGQL
ncbi:MAG: hypothetical protein C5B60_01525 [Chloroflexi bacterium]|nr:MAG: hypothetical protein C5B60_01525 [Chloroflexota bacterium]